MAKITGRKYYGCRGHSGQGGEAFVYGERAQDAKVDPPSTIFIQFTKVYHIAGSCTLLIFLEEYMWPTGNLTRRGGFRHGLLYTALMFRDFRGSNFHQDV